VDPDLSAPKKPKRSNDFLKYSGLGLQMLATIGVAAWLGLLLDRYLQFQFPLFLLLFVMLAFGGSIYQLYRSINK
jgi:F0F1-type ATP synthase assembly protein I